MGANDFPAWYSAGIFGGIGCALLSAIVIATWSLWSHRGVTGQVIGALLVCLIASALDIGPLLWIEYRLNVYGPTLSAGEVGAALAMAALVGWAAPLATMCWYLLLASPAAPAAVRAARPGAVSPAAMDDPARAQAVYSGGQPWGLLVPAEPTAEATAEATPARPITLTQELTLIGRELDNDIVLDDDRVSRRHAELRYDHGRVELADYGSLNGTLINQQAARGRLPLRDGDLIDLGKRRYRLQLLPSAAAVVGDAPEHLETRKTASASGAFSSGAPRLQMALIQGGDVSGESAVWPLRAPVTTIGRDPTCGIFIADTSISRMHAQITRQPAGHFIADLQSSNGVYLNGQRLAAPAQIFAGDVVALGDCLLRCDEITAQAAATPAILSAPADADADAAPSTEGSASPTISRTPTGAPAFHMRLSPAWSARRDSRPRLAPPRLTPTTRQTDTPTT